MRNFIFFVLLGVTCTVQAQITDSLVTPLGAFVLVTIEDAEESTGYSEESLTTSDGGTIEFVAINSGARFASAINENQKMVVNISPNPSADVAQLKISGVDGPVSIVVTNTLGQMVYTSTITVTQSRTTYLPVQVWPAGTYLVVISAGGAVETERLVVQ